jgi:hypothetical protein
VPKALKLSLVASANSQLPTFRSEDQVIVCQGQPTLSKISIVQKFRAFEVDRNGCNNRLAVREQSRSCSKCETMKARKRLQFASFRFRDSAKNSVPMEVNHSLLL